ncbi:hypothetical protein ACOCEA_00085 [Maribacter sp. CXY002]|uniref:hypothetical protein n=1 Tax=Maribacter luteocoastalis TaxID=3407671 RepID=UPI003B677705
MYDEKKRNDTGQKNKHGHRQRVIFDISTDYRKVNNKMYLNYISFHNSFTLNIPPVFNVEYITVNTDRRCFVVEYNNIPESKPAMHLPNYKVEFKKKRVKLKTAQRLKNKIFLYPEMEDEKIDQVMKTIATAQRAGEDLHNLIEVQVSNVRDTIGNLVNQWSQMEYNQFREFFTQRVKPDTKSPFEGVFMDMQKPIFHDQPVSRPKNYDDYWMNTPLQNKID